MTVMEAIIAVLKEAAQPLKAMDIASQAIARGLWQTDGKTPDATVSARIYMDIKRRKHESLFVQTAPNTFALRNGSQALQLLQNAADSPQDVTTVPRTKAKSPRTTARQPAPITATTYSFTDAAERVLETFGDKKPMHYQQITEKALENGWVVTEGKTPEASMYAQVLTEIKRCRKRDVPSRFVQHGRGFVGLTKWMGRGLAFDIEQHNKRVRQSMHKRLLAMDWGDFEDLVARLLVEIGFEDVEVTQRSGDKGIDVRGTLVVGEVIRTRMAVQAKKWKPETRVDSPVIQQVRGSLGTHEQGLIITTSDFTTGARTEAARPNAVPVGLMNGQQLVALLAEYGIGITRRTHDIIELDEQGQIAPDANVT